MNCYMLLACSVLHWLPFTFCLHPYFDCWVSSRAYSLTVLGTYFSCSLLNGHKLCPTIFRFNQTALICSITSMNVGNLRKAMACWMMLLLETYHNYRAMLSHFISASKSYCVYYIDSRLLWEGLLSISDAYWFIRHRNTLKLYVVHYQLHIHRPKLSVWS